MLRFLLYSLSISIREREREISKIIIEKMLMKIEDYKIIMKYLFIDLIHSFNCKLLKQNTTLLQKI